MPVTGSHYHASESKEVKSLTQTVHMISGTMQKGPSKPYNVKCEGEGLRVAEIGKRNEFVVDAGTAGELISVCCFTNVLYLIRRRRALCWGIRAREAV